MRHITVVLCCALLLPLHYYVCLVVQASYEPGVDHMLLTCRGQRVLPMQNNNKPLFKTGKIKGELIVSPSFSRLPTESIATLA